MPKKPTTTPNHCVFSILLEKREKPIRIVHMGVVAFTTEAMLLLMDISLTAIRAHGRALFNKAISSRGIHGRFFRSLNLPWNNSKMNSVPTPNMHLQKTTPHTPISPTSNLINRNDVPQIKLNVNNAIYSRFIFLTTLLFLG